MRSKVLVAVFLCLPALTMGAKRVDVTTTEKTQFLPGGTVRIEGSTGEVNVEGWDEPAVEIQVVRSAWTDQEDRTKARLNLIQVSNKMDGHELTLTTAHKRFTGGQVSYRIRVPRNTKLVIHHGIGDVVVFGVDGDIDATAKTGDVTVQLNQPARYEIDAYTKLGSIYSDFDAKVRHRRLGMGESINPAVEGSGDTRHVSLHVTTGGISIQKVMV
jgi:hypothetical protein